MRRDERQRHSRGLWPILVVGILGIAALGKSTEVLGPWSIPIWFSSIGAVVWLLKGPFGEALLRSIADRDRDPDAPGTDPGVLQELDDLRAQVSELQERMDFTERLLARERETRPLGAGDHA